MDVYIVTKLFGEMEEDDVEREVWEFLAVADSMEGAEEALYTYLYTHFPSVMTNGEWSLVRDVEKEDSEGRIIVQSIEFDRGDGMVGEADLFRLARYPVLVSEDV